MKKLLSLILSVVILSSYTQAITFASETDKPWLIYGCDPVEGDIYETYGDTYFLDKHPVKKPSKKFYVSINNETVRNMIAKADAEGYGSLAHIITEDYFPELEIEEMIYGMKDPDYYKLQKSYYLSEDKPCLQIIIRLKNYSKEAVTNGLKALAPRADVDIVEAFPISYNLTDASNVLKYSAGWGSKYYRADYDYNGDVRINVHDATCILKFIAGWNEDNICLQRPSDELVRQINDDLNRYLVDNYGYPPDKIYIRMYEYHGTYNGAVVFMTDEMSGDMTGSDYIDGIEITYIDTNRLTVWKDGEFYRINSAYNKGILTRDDVKEIAYIQNSRMGINLLFELF